MALFVASTIVCCLRASLICKCCANVLDVICDAPHVFSIQIAIVRVYALVPGCLTSDGSLVCFILFDRCSFP